ncbi:MAG: PIN domain-containing protein [Patescibacteria group bacterium]
MLNKSKETLFIDTSFFKAMLDSSDDFHNKAVKTLSTIEKNGNPLVTTNYILDEAFTLIRQRMGVGALKIFREALLQNEWRLKVARTTIQDEENAWDYMLKDWSNLSFTDCVSFAVMKRLSIQHACTFDSHFSSAGFSTVP